MKLRDPRTPNWRYRFSTEIRLASNCALIALRGGLQGITYVFCVARRDSVEFSAFKKRLPEICADRYLEPDELTFGDFVQMVGHYLKTIA